MARIGSLGLVAAVLNGATVTPLAPASRPASGERASPSEAARSEARRSYRQASCVGPPREGERTARGDLRWVFDIASGFDSNPRQRAGSSGAASVRLGSRVDLSRAAIDRGHLRARFAGRLDLNLGARPVHRGVVGVRGGWTTGLIGSRPARPRFRFDLRGDYALGFRLDPGSESYDEGAEPEDDLLSELGIAFLAPVHDLKMSARARLRPTRRTQAGLRVELRRSWRSGEPGRSARHFTELAAEARAGHRFGSRVRLSTGYEMRVRSFDELIGSRGGRRRDWIHEPWLGVQLRLLPLRLVVRYGPRWRSSNREGRDTLRHELELEVRHRLLRGLDVELESELRAEDRFGRPDRAWTRVRLMAGVRWRFSRPPSLPSSHRP